MKRVVGDLEADGLLDEASVIWCGVFKDIDTQELHVFRPDEVHLIPEFLDTVDALVMHNGIAYDKPLMQKVLGYEYKGALIDTLVMSRLQDPRRVPPKGVRAGPHSVESYGARFGRKKPQHEDWSRYSEDMLHRCTEDVHIQCMILDHLLETGKGKGWKNAHKLSFKLFDILHKQEQYGWLVDQEHMHWCIRILTHWMDRIDRVTKDSLPMQCIRAKKNGQQYSYYKAPFKKDGTLQGYVLTYVESTNGSIRVADVGGPFSCVNFRRVSLDSNAETKDFLLSAGWEPEEWNTDSLGNRTSPKLSHTEGFSGIRGALGRLIARRVQCRHRRSQIEGLIKCIRSDGRIAQRITGIAETGRLKHSVIVNIPGTESFFGQQIRRCFICKDETRIVGVDSSGCQNRMLAGRVRNDRYTEAILHGRKEDQTSIHHLNQEAIQRIAGIEVSYRVCKNLNYAFLFGASDNKLAATANVEKAKGPAIRDALLSVAPGLGEVISSLEAEWRATAKKRKGKYGIELYDGTITGLDGRPVLIGSPHCILVYTLQSDEAIMMQYALCLLYDWLTERGWVHGREYGFVANVHDEFQAEVREDLAEEYAELACKAIAQAGQDLNIACPHQGEYDIGINWYETH